MKMIEIRDDNLRAWVDAYVADVSKKRSEEKRDTWRRMTEGDWAAFRELLDLRPRALVSFEQSDIDLAVLARIDSLPGMEIHGVRYRHPYSLGLEVGALREMLSSAPQEYRTPVQRPMQVDPELDFGSGGSGGYIQDPEHG